MWKQFSCWKHVKNLRAYGNIACAAKMFLNYMKTFFASWEANFVFPSMFPFLLEFQYRSIYRSRTLYCQLFWSLNDFAININRWDNEEIVGSCRTIAYWVLSLVWRQLHVDKLCRKLLREKHVQQFLSLLLVNFIQLYLHPGSSHCCVPTRNDQLASMLMEKILQNKFL